MRPGYHIRISVSKPAQTSQTSSSYSRPQFNEAAEFIPSSLFQILPAHPPKSTGRRYTFHHPRSQTPAEQEHTDYRFGPLRIDWVDFDTSAMDVSGSKKAAIGKERDTHGRGEKLFRIYLNYAGGGSLDVRSILPYLIMILEKAVPALSRAPY